MNNYRYERKFLIEGISRSEIVKYIFLNPNMFKEIYSKRFINNIYFDTIGLKYFYDNIDGSMNRLKVRLRWYGRLFGKVGKPQLEFKIKEGLSGKKETYPIKPFVFEKGLISEKILEHIMTSNLRNGVTEKLSFLEPIIINRYQRKYFISSNERYRITLDYNQSYCAFIGNQNLIPHANSTELSSILELKYSIRDEDNVDQITNSFPFRLTKSSKYVNAIKELF